VKLGLKAKLAIVLSAIVLAAFLLVYVATTSLATSVLMDQEYRGLTTTVDTVVPLLLDLADNQAELDKALHLSGQRSQLETLQVLTDGLETAAPRECTPAEILVGQEGMRALLQTRDGVGLVPSPTLGRLLVAIRPLPGGGFLFAARKAAPLFERRESITALLVIWGAIVLLAILLCGSIVLRSMVLRPIDRLVSEAGAVAAGEKGLVPAGVDSDQFGALRGSLQAMAERLRQERQRIEEQVQELTQVNLNLKEAREHLIRTEKLASIGQLAAGVAHEIGNPIGVVLGYVEMLEDPRLDPAARENALKEIRKATLRIKTTIRELLDFSRPADDETAASNPVKEVQEVIRLVSPQKRFRNVVVNVKDELGTPALCAIPPSRLQQVMLNLLFNAADAMEGNGEVTVTLSRQPKTVRIAVADAGPGIDDSVLLRIFDPFFTTKEVGKGTGLGLFVCHTIMSRYGGEIEVATGLKGGTVMTLVLPLAGFRGATGVPTAT
jgi:signal transduction histidine kinase